MDPDVNEPISPELVLVDPELAARMRPFAVAGPTRAPAAALVLRPPLPDDEPQEDPAEPPRDVAAAAPAPAAVRHRGGRFVTVLTVLAGAALLGAAFLPPREAPRLTDGAPPATAAPPATPAPPGAPTSPTDPAQPQPNLRPPLTLTWRPVRDADYYLVEILAGERLVHATTTRRARLVAPSWLDAGRYTWRVLAGNGRPSERQVRGPLESGWFVVTT